MAAAIHTIIVPICDFVHTERLKMKPGHVPYRMWETPAPEVKLRLYIFTVENAESFLNGTDEKLHLKEIGPIVYREHLQHRDVVYHENSTMSYTAHRNLEFLEHENEPGILNRTILVPNFVILVRTQERFEIPFNFKLITFFFFHFARCDDVFINI